MAEEKYFASRVFVGLMWAGLVVALISAALQVGRSPWWVQFLVVVGQFGMGGFFAWNAWRASKTPIFSISERRISVRHPFGGVTTLLNWSDVRGVRWKNRGAICLGLVNGKYLTLNMSLLSRRSREALDSAVDNRLPPAERLTKPTTSTTGFADIEPA